jgi:hypothetical protein
MKPFIRFEDELRSYYERFVKPTIIPDLLGKTLKVSQKQFGWVYAMSESIAADLKMDMPDIFIYQSYYYVVESKGLADNWIEISAKVLTDFSSDELMFMLVKEMCSIKLRYTYYDTLAKQEMDTAENVISFPGSKTLISALKIKMRHYLRIAGYSSDNFAYILCGSLTPCVNAIIKTVMNDTYLAEHINISEFLKQGENINGLREDVHSFTKMDELSPYSPFRIKSLIAYASSERGIKALNNTMSKRVSSL